jgi:D-glycero-D-manno-heptose 1,7-bisphosphate phosphatase
MKRAVFLDRDGVINRAEIVNGKSFAPQSLEKFELLPGVEEATRKLSDHGFRLIVVTNQPDVALGRIRRDVVEVMHERIRRTLPVDDIKVCYHTDADNCSCRKPKPGMLTEAGRQWGIDLAASYMIGDRWRDIAAGKAAGCKTILVRAEHDDCHAESPDAIVQSLLEASTMLVEGKLG